MYLGSFYFDIPRSLPVLTPVSFWFILFLFLVFLLARFLPGKIHPFVLLIADIIFLYSFSGYDLLFVVMMALFGYMASFRIVKEKTKGNLLIGVVPVILVLAFMKYAGRFLPERGILFPLGLSFYSFKIISYLVDIYRGDAEQERDPLSYFNYVLFFPCITAGPINRAKEFFRELKEPKEFEYRDAKNGGIKFLLGLFEKVVFANYIGEISERIFANSELTGMNVLLGIILYSFYIYLDFDSYSHIAIGSARVLGFHIPKNFHTPYLSRSLKEFWSRWHISLSTWFKDYVYIPLGGNRKGKLRQYLAILIVFLLSGIWHGSTVNFALWGLLHGVLRILEDILYAPFRKSESLRKVLAIPAVLINFAVVSFLWLIFRSSSLQEVFSVLEALKRGGGIDFALIGMTRNEVLWLFAVLVITILLDICRYFKDMIEFLADRFIVLRWIFYALLVVVFLVMGVYGGSFDPSDFIYKWF